jgi:hypothetical protein
VEQHKHQLPFCQVQAPGDFRILDHIAWEALQKEEYRIKSGIGKCSCHGSPFLEEDFATDVLILSSAANLHKFSISDHTTGCELIHNVQISSES